MIYDNVKTLAQKQGLSIAALEKKANLSNGTIGKWQKVNPSVGSLISVAKVLKVNVNILLKSIEDK